MTKCEILAILFFLVPRVQAVVYGTRSQFRAENEVVVNRSIEFINMMQQKKTPWRVSPPVIPLSQRDIENESPLSGKFLSFPADYTTSGCFLATITREVRNNFKWSGFYCTEHLTIL